MTPQTKTPAASGASLRTSAPSASTSSSSSATASGAVLQGAGDPVATSGPSASGAGIPVIRALAFRAPLTTSRSNTAATTGATTSRDRSIADIGESASNINSVAVIRDIEDGTAKGTPGMLLRSVVREARGGATEIGSAANTRTIAVTRQGGQAGTGTTTTIIAGAPAFQDAASSRLFPDSQVVPTTIALANMSNSTGDIPRENPKGASTHSVGDNGSAATGGPGEILRIPIRSGINGRGGSAPAGMELEQKGVPRLEAGAFAAPAANATSATVTRPAERARSRNITCPAVTPAQAMAVPARVTVSRSAEGPPPGGAPPGTLGNHPNQVPPEEEDEGEGSADDEDYTFFASNKRRRIGTGRLPKPIYDRVRINDNATEMNELRAQIANAEKVGQGGEQIQDMREELRQLGEQVFMIRLGDVAELMANGQSDPYVGKIIELDREHKRCKVHWYFVFHELDARTQGLVLPKEVLLSTTTQGPWQDLASIHRKVNIVSELPPDGDLPDDTYLCRRGYDWRGESIIDLKDALEHSMRGKSKKKRGRPRSRLSLISQSRNNQDDSDNGEDGAQILLRRFNRIGPEFDIEVPSWSGPANVCRKPTPQQRVEVEAALSQQRVWTKASSNLLLDPQNAYMRQAFALAPIFRNTIVFIRPEKDGRWADGHDPPIDSGSSSAMGALAAADGAVYDDPQVTRVKPPFLRWGLVVAPPSHTVETSAPHLPPAFAAGHGLPLMDMECLSFAGSGASAIAVGDQSLGQLLPSGIARVPIEFGSKTGAAAAGNLNSSGGSCSMTVVGQSDRGCDVQVMGDAHGVEVEKVAMGVVDRGEILWIANPDIKRGPLPVKRWRVLPLEFEDDAMEALWCAQGNSAAALIRLASPEYQATVAKRLEDADEFWTQEQVNAAVKVCEHSERGKWRKEELGDLGDDDEIYPVDGKQFHKVVDFRLRFHAGKRFGACSGSRNSGNSDSVRHLRSSKRRRPVEGAYSISRTNHKQQDGKGDNATSTRRRGGRPPKAAQKGGRPSSASRTAGGARGRPRSGKLSRGSASSENSSNRRDVADGAQDGGGRTAKARARIAIRHTATRGRGGGADGRVVVRRGRGSNAGVGGDQAEVPRASGNARGKAKAAGSSSELPQGGNDYGSYKDDEDDEEDEEESSEEDQSDESDAWVPDSSEMDTEDGFSMDGRSNGRVTPTMDKGALDTGSQSKSTQGGGPPSKPVSSSPAVGLERAAAAAASVQSALSAPSYTADSKPTHDHGADAKDDRSKESNSHSCNGGDMAKQQHETIDLSLSDTDSEHECQGLRLCACVSEQKLEAPQQSPRHDIKSEFRDSSIDLTVSSDEDSEERSRERGRALVSLSVARGETNPRDAPPGGNAHSGPPQHLALPVFPASVLSVQALLSTPQNSHRVSSPGIPLAQPMEIDSGADEPGPSGNNDAKPSGASMRKPEDVGTGGPSPGFRNGAAMPDEASSSTGGGASSTASMMQGGACCRNTGGQEDDGEFHDVAGGIDVGNGALASAGGNSGGGAQEHKGKGRAQDGQDEQHRQQAVSDASEGGENAHIVPVPVQEGVPEHNVEEMKAFFVRLRDILDPTDFRDLVAGLQQYRAREMTVEDLVVHAGDCLATLQGTPNAELITTFNVYLPPGIAVPLLTA